MKSIEKIVSISGLPGLYQLEATRGNGLIISDLDTGNRQFVSVRKHQFNPLQSLAIYTYTDSVSLDTIFERLLIENESNPVNDILTQNDKLISEYFRDILPDFDEDKVTPKIIKKVLKWFVYLNDRNLIKTEEEPAQKKEEE
jgi:hypothetical protein